MAGWSSLSDRRFHVSVFVKETNTHTKKSHLLVGFAMFRWGSFVSFSHLRHEEGSHIGVFTIRLSTVSQITSFYSFISKVFITVP